MVKKKTIHQLVRIASSSSSGSVGEIDPALDVTEEGVSWTSGRRRLSMTYQSMIGNDLTVIPTAIDQGVGGVKSGGVRQTG